MAKLVALKHFAVMLSQQELNICRKFVLLCNKPLLLRLLSMVELVRLQYFVGFLLLSTSLLFLGTSLEPTTRLAIAVSCSIVLYRLLKAICKRPRPWMLEEELALGSRMRKTTSSFPSGHAIILVAASVVMLDCSTILAAITLPYVVLSLAARLGYAQHYPSDILAGALLGTSIGLLATLV